MRIPQIDYRISRWFEKQRQIASRVLPLSFGQRLFVIAGVFLLAGLIFVFLPTGSDSNYQSFIESAQKWSDENLDRDVMENVNIEKEDIEKALHAASAYLNDFVVSQKTAEQDAEIKKRGDEIKRTDATLAERRRTLTNLEHQIKLINLSSNQLAMVESYNRSIIHEPATFGQWITKPTTRYELGKAILISTLFFMLGCFLAKERKKRKKRNSPKSTD